MTIKVCDMVQCSRPPGNIERVTLMLNSEQTQAVEHSRGPVLVVSGPGSGKTRVITERIANLINSRNVPPWKILAITFTNKAAKEMKERVDVLLGSSGHAVVGGTFHATCARILRQAGSAVGVPNDFVIYDTDDSESVVKSVMKELNTPEQFTPRQIRNRISSFKTSGHLTESVSSISGNSFLDEISIKVLTEYDRRLRQSGAVDFDDLLNKTHLLLTEYRSDAATFLNRFEHVLVDEFQDTNRVQYEIAKSLAGKSRNFFIVGDEDQSIYSWRAADVQNFQRFKDDFPEADVIYLGQNYRSTGNIIRAAETIINKSSGRSEKALWTENTDGDAVRIMVTGNSEEEAWFVANQIEDKLSGALSESDTYGILYRTNAQSRAFEEALIGLSIPYRLVGGTRFYERKEIKDLIAYLRLVHNEHDSVAFQRVVNIPPRGIGVRTLAAVLGHAHEHAISPVAALAKLAITDGTEIIGSRAKKATGQFTSDYDDITQASENRSVADTLDQIIRRTGFKDYIFKLDKEQPDRADSRWENVEELLNVAAQYQESDDEASLATFLEQVALVSDVDQPDGTSAQVQVTLTTLHSAKGLEFSTVFLVGMEEGLLPHQRSFDTQEMLEEERRLCYVGMTRAKNQLFMTRSINRYLYGRSTSTISSRYLDELTQPEIEREHYGDIDPTAQDAQRNRTNSYSYRRNSFGLKDARIETDATNTRPPFSPGDKVRHGRFGLGTVISIKQDGKDWEIQVAFESQGVRRLYQSFAQLVAA